MSSHLPDWRSLPRDERIKKVRHLLDDGLSMGQIAAHFQNASRNAVIGLVRRVEAAEGEPMKRNSHKQALKVARKASPAPKPKSWRSPLKPAKTDAPVPVLPKIKAPVEVQISTPVEVELAPDTRISREKAFLPLDGITPIALIDIPHRSRCRWPVDVPGEMHFACGAQTITDDHPYCATHRRISIEGAKPQGAI